MICSLTFPETGFDSGDSLHKLSKPVTQSAKRCYGVDNNSLRTVWLTDNIGKNAKHISGFRNALRKHAYSNVRKISPPKNWKKNQIKSLIFFIFLLKT